MRAILVVCLLVFSSVGFAQTADPDIETLRGISGVYVLVEQLSDDIEGEELSVPGIRENVEYLLKDTGLNILTAEESLKEPGMPYIYIKVSTAKRIGGTCGYHISFELHQNALLERNEQMVAIGACTYQKSNTGIILRELAPAVILDTIRIHTRQFVTDYKSVNPLQAINGVE